MLKTAIFWDDYPVLKQFSGNSPVTMAASGSSAAATIIQQAGKKIQRLLK